MKEHLALEDPSALRKCWQQYGREFKYRPNVFNSVAYDGKLEQLIALKQAGTIDVLAIDSGTFTSQKTGKKITIAEYSNLIGIYAEEIDWFAAVDEDFNDPEVNLCRYNQLIYDFRGSPIVDQIVPVIHSSREAAEEFDVYASTAKMIGIGSKTSIPNDEWLKINAIRYETGVEIHIMGNLGLELLKKRMPESADAAAYAHSAAFGQVMYWNEQRKIMERFKPLDAEEFTDAHRQYFQEQFGLKATELIGPGSAEVKWLVNIYALLKMQDYLNDEWYPTHMYEID